MDFQIVSLVNLNGFDFKHKFTYQYYIIGPARVLLDATCSFIVQDTTNYSFIHSFIHKCLHTSVIAISIIKLTGVPL